MWNDTDTPLAVFFTVRCFGTWLHGDDRGSVDRHRNTYGTPRIPANSKWEDYNRCALKRPPVLLGAARRKSVENGIRRLCEKRGWNIHALNVRTNHIHAVLDIRGANSRRALGSLKAYSTRQMREDGNWNSEETPWAEKGSRRNLWNERSVLEACDYVLNRQGDDLPDFDWW